MTTPKRLAGRTARFTALFIISLLVLAVVAVGLAGLSPVGARLLASAVSAIASNEERTVVIAPPSGLLTGKLRVESVTIGDREGTYAEIGDLAVDWSPAALLRGAFHADLVSASRISLLRKPLPSQKQDDEPFSLPIAVEINRIAAPDIALAETVLGQPFALAAQGALEARRDRASLTLSVDNREQQDARANANLVYAPEENRLTLEATLSEPQGGMLARLASLPGAPAVELALTGSGPLSDWRGTLTGKVDGEEVLKLDGEHRLMKDGNALRLTGGGAPASLLPPAFRPLFTGETTVDIAATLRDGGGLRIETGRIENTSFRLNAEGLYDPTGGANSLTAKLSGVNGPVDFRWPLETGEARALIEGFDLSLSGPASAAKLSAMATFSEATLPQGGLGGLRLALSSDALNLATRAGRLHAELSAATSRFTEENLDRLVRAPLKLSAPLLLTPESLAIEGAELESASIGGALTGAYTFAAKAFSGDVRLFALPAVLPPALAEKLTQTVALEGRVTAANGDFGVENLMLKSELAQASGAVTLKGSALDVDLKGDLADLGKLLDDASGVAAFTLAASGPVEKPGFTASLDASGAVLAGKAVERLTVKAEGVADPAAPTAELTANGRLDGQALAATARLVSGPQGPEIPSLSLEAGPNRANGALRFTPDFRPASGNLTFNLPDISLLAALAGQKASGNLSGQAALTPANGRTGLTVKASGSIASADASLERLALDLSMPDITAIAVNGALSATRAGTPTANVQNLKLDITHANGATGLTLNGRYDDAPLALKGALRQEGGALLARLESFSAAPKRIPVRLAAPTTIRVENGTATLNGLRIATGNGSVTVNGSAGKVLNLTAALAALPASLANAFAPDLAAEGTISGEVRVTGEAANPAITYRLDWANAATSQTRGAGLSPLGVKANGTFTDGRLGLDTAINGGGLTLNGGGTVDTAGAKALSLAFKGRVPLAALQSKLTEQGLAAEGAADVDISVGGTAATPQVTGTITLNGAKIIDLRRNLTLNNLTGSVRFDGNQATISSLSGRLGGGGTVNASGTVGINPQAGFPADIAIKLSGATYADGTLFTTSANGDLALKGPLLSAPVLSGKLTMANTAITIPAQLPATLSEIDIRHKNAPPDVKAQARAIKSEETNGASSSSSLGLDLTISSTSPIFVRGRGIDAELGGDLTIRGTAADPVVSGGFDMRRGRFTILSRRLDFTSGTITFGGALIPVLNMVATSTVNSTTITAKVTGLANDPAIAFSSSPALPQDEVIAQLIFGQSMSKLSALQIAQLADAVRQLAGGRSTSLFESLRANLGVDDLDISTDEKGDTRVSAGKYLNDRTYIQLEQGGASGGKASINLDVGRGVKLRGEAGADGSGAAGIFYEREY